MPEENDSRWKEARERMKPYLDAIFWQDLGIGGAQNRKYVDWILDRIIRPEFDRVLGTSESETWCLMRLDDNGNEFVVSEGHTFHEASVLMETYEARGHKQTCWVKRK